MKLTVTLPFVWDGKSYAVGDVITDPKLVKAIRAGGPKNHFVAVKA